MLMSSVELRHIDRGPGSDEVPGGVGLIEVKVSTEGSAVDVIERSRSVLRGVLTMTLDELRSPSAGALRLPVWFVAGCAPERSTEDDERWLAWWRGLDPEARARASDERPWSVGDWLYWMLPEERQWYWWDARVDRDRSARVFVEVAGWPTATGALQWLLRVAGASSVDVSDGP
jgi:hypothetical protein